MDQLVNMVILPLHGPFVILEALFEGVKAPRVVANAPGGVQFRRRDDMHHLVIEDILDEKNGCDRAIEDRMNADQAKGIVPVAQLNVAEVRRGRIGPAPPCDAELEASVEIVAIDAVGQAAEVEVLAGGLKFKGAPARGRRANPVAIFADMPPDFAPRALRRPLDKFDEHLERIGLGFEKHVMDADAQRPPLRADHRHHVVQVVVEPHVGLAIQAPLNKILELEKCHHRPYPGIRSAMGTRPD